MLRSSLLLAKAAAEEDDDNLYGLLGKVMGIEIPDAKELASV